jgi:Flp pilus assembly protein TadD
MGLVRDLRALWRAHELDLGLGACLLLLALGIYAPVRHFDFINYDDPVYVTQNLHVTSGLNADNLRWAFTNADVANWFPLTWISLMANCQFWGLEAGPQHLTNVLLHAASTLLLFALLKRITGATGPSAMVAFLFALHPLHVESVAWVAERKDVLSALFWMLTLLSYARYVSRPKPGAYLLTLLLYCLGFLAKPMVVTLPAVLVLLDFWPLRRYPPSAERAQFIRGQIREKAPFFVLATLMSVTTVLVQRSGGAVRPVELFSISTRLGNAVVSGLVYIGKMLWPTRLVVFYPLSGGPALWQVTASGAVLIGITALVLRLVRTRPYLLVGWFWYLITLLPVIGIIQVGDQSRADRYMYIPMIGLSMMLAWGAADVWQEWPKARTVLVGLGAAAGLACLMLTARQVSYWENSKTLFVHAIQVTSDNAIAHGCLGDALRVEGRYEDALVEYREAIAIQPRYVAALINMGVDLGLLGRPQEALAPLSSAIRLKGDDVDARNAFGLALAMQGRLKEAEEQFDVAIRLKPDSVLAHTMLGNTFGNLGRMDDAIAQFQEALRLQPSSPEARANLQKALAMRDRVK